MIAQSRRRSVVASSSWCLALLFGAYACTAETVGNPKSIAAGGDETGEAGGNDGEVGATNAGGASTVLGGAQSGGDDGFGAGGAGAGEAGTKGGAGASCGAVSFSLDKPAIVILLDASGTMFESHLFEAFGPVITGEHSALAQVSDRADFGFMSFVATRTEDMTEGCLLATPTATHGESSVSAVSTAYASTQKVQYGQTPTGDGIAAAAALLDELPGDRNKQIYLIAEGTSDTCWKPDPQCGADHAIYEAQRAFDAGIEVQVLGLKSDPPNANSGCVGRCDEDFFQDLANAGHGYPVKNQGPEYWIPCVTASGREPEGTYAPDDAGETPNASFTVSTTTEQMVESFLATVDATTGCTFRLAEAAASAQGVRVTLDGAELEYGGRDGFAVNGSGDVVTLRGRACSDVKGLPKEALQIELPCESE